MLLAADADARAQNAYGETPLHLASREGHAECVKELLAGGARVSAYTQHGGHSAIHYAAGGGHLPVIKQLERALGPEALVLASSSSGTPARASTPPTKKGKGGAKKSKSPVRASISAGGGGLGKSSEMPLGPPVKLASINGLSAAGELPMLRAVRALGGASACTVLAANQFKEVPDDLVGVEGTLQYLGSSYASPFDPPAKVKIGGKKAGGAKGGGAKKGGKKK